ncbi:two-component system histidine kinase PnpS [Gelria sp. Kuro-4]|uniref:two-component system histidine kinase PnpS n=1 Tax=Gelria sp. Kuro-4 TaxID=2796927 RepID=UPI001BEDCDD9|nr:ATP-binding protein [Gelria sp. Kuro-4]BCV25370.1 PAS domain-containing sensor histidine kinase [Gelria sp. Kuro-4]
MRLSLRWKLTLSYLLVSAALLLVLAGFLAHAWSVLGPVLPAVEPGVWRRLELMLLSAAGLAVLIAFFLGVKLAGDISNPLEEVTRAARRLAQGDFSVRLRVRSQDEIGQLAAAFGYMSETLKARLEEINAAKSRLEAVLHYTVSGLMLLDTRCRVVMMNPAAEKLFGLAPGAAVGRHNIEVVRDYHLSTAINEAMRNHQVVSREVTFLYPEERTVRAYVAPVWEDKEVTGLIVVFHDITELRRLERMRTEFVASVSHELRTPLTAIRGFSETLLDGALADKAAAEHFLRIIDDEARRLTALIDDLLDLSRLELKRANLKLENFALLPLVESIAASLKPRLDKAALTLSVEIKDPELAVQADRDRIRQVLLNLIDNSIKYTPAGGRISISAAALDGTVRVAVADTGRGIPSEDLERIFERFYRVDKARSRSEGGTGLGLAIVKHIIELHGGKVEAQSELGKGTTIAFTIPAGKV